MDELKTLSNATLAELPANVRVPLYDRSALTPGIVHIGLGNFHRAHQAWYLHRLMDAGLAHDWAIIGAGVRAGDAAQRDRLLAQDCLTTLIELCPDSTSAEVCGSMIDFLPVEADNASLVAQLADPSTRIAALTVTEGGYYTDPVTGGFAEDHEDIQADAANPDAPITAFGAMIKALRIRRDAGTGPFTVLSCDNLQGNGVIVRQTVVGLAQLSDPELAGWIDTQCTFPNSMVDCIVPATGPAELELVRTLGINDQAPVTHENFRQWVIEDAFCAGRPDWDKVGATFTDDVHDFEAMKIRMLNGGHQILANAGEVLGIETISDAMAHPSIAALFLKTQGEEIAPHVDDVPGLTPQDYISLIMTRFANPAIIDTTRRVAFDGASRHPGFLLPTIRAGLASGDPVNGLALVEAIWARMCEGRRENGSEIEANDPIWDTLNAAAKAAKTNPSAWLDQSNIYGDLKHEPAFASAFTHWLSVIWANGTEAAIAEFTQGEGGILHKAGE